MEEQTNKGGDSILLEEHFGIQGVVECEIGLDVLRSQGRCTHGSRLLKN
jgi:hypothetical protein